MKNKEGLLLLVVLHVDDLFINSNSVAGLISINFSLNKAFVVTYLGLLI